MWACKRCGKTDNPNNNNYCSSCGAPKDKDRKISSVAYLAVILPLILIIVGMSLWVFKLYQAKKTLAWKEAYKAIIANAKGQMSHDNTLFQDSSLQLTTYTLYDMDKDGIPELVLHFGRSTAGAEGNLYSFRGGEAVLLKEFAFGGNYLSSYPNGNGMIFRHARMGGQNVKLWTLETGQIVESEPLFSEEVKANLYTPIGKIVDGSVDLTEFPLDTLAPLLQYEEWEKVIHPKRSRGDLDTKARTRFPENNSNFFQNVIDGNKPVIPIAVSREYDLMWNKPATVETLYADAERAMAESSSNYQFLKSGDYIDFRNRTVKYADINGDGQLEAIISFSKQLDEYWFLQQTIILSEQEGTVFAYELMDIEVLSADSSGILYYYKNDWVVNSTYEYAFKLFYNRESCFFVYVPIENYSGDRIQ